MLNHITTGHLTHDEEIGKRSFQPMNINFGLFPPLTAEEQQGLSKKELRAQKKSLLATRARKDFVQWLQDSNECIKVMS